MKQVARHVKKGFRKAGGERFILSEKENRRKNIATNLIILFMV